MCGILLISAYLKTYLDFDIYKMSKHGTTSGMWFYPDIDSVYYPYEL